MAGQRREDNDEDLEDQDEDELDQEVLSAAVFALFLCSTVLNTVQGVCHATMLAKFDTHCPAHFTHLGSHVLCVQQA